MRLPALALARLRSDPAWTALVSLALASGIVLRIWILKSGLGALDSDEAVTGLMARHALHGEFSAFYWLNLYGGSQESLLAALVFAVANSSTLALKLVPLSLYGLSAFLVWLVGRRTVGGRAAVVAALLFWVWPAYFVWWTTKARAFYAVGLVCVLLVLLLVLRLRERDSRRDAAALGLVLGIGFWATPEIAVFALPALVWLAWRRRGAFRLAWLAVPGALAGAAPWIVWNALNDGKALGPPPSIAGMESTYLERLGDFFRFVFPTWLGVRVPYSLDWLLGPVVGIAIVVLALGSFVTLLARRPRELELLLVIGATFPFFYALSRFAYYVDEPRYLVLLAPVPALLLGWRAASIPSATFAVAATLVLSVAGLVQMQRDRLYAPHDGGVSVPTDISPLMRLLERESVQRVLASYWLAYRISFESRERIIATSTGFVRYVPHDRLVRESAYPARVFVEGSADERELRLQLERSGYRRLTADGFVAYVHPGSR
jgi:4-amino-4-deoxy-L-arabinose transferase-like glycosyltransferase